MSSVPLLIKDAMRSEVGCYTLKPDGDGGFSAGMLTCGKVNR